MAWRPSQYLIEGELDNTVPGKVTGWMRFKGMKEAVTFDLSGDFHRDIRGAKLRIDGPGEDADEGVADFYMHGLNQRQTGRAGDITAGREPHDYGRHPYVEWYGDENGRVVIEAPPEAVEVIGEPVPWQAEAPVSRQQQDEQLTSFVMGMARDLSTRDQSDETPGMDDPSFSHWVVENGMIVGEAREIEPIDGAICIAYVRLFQRPEMAGCGRIATDQLQPKHPDP